MTTPGWIRAATVVTVLVSQTACMTAPPGPAPWPEDPYYPRYTPPRPAARVYPPPIDEDSIRTIQMLEQKIRLLERRLAAMTSYTPNDLKEAYPEEAADRERAVATAGEGRAPSVPVRPVLTPPPAMLGNGTDRLTAVGTRPDSTVARASSSRAPRSAREDRVVSAGVLPVNHPIRVPSYEPSGSRFELYYRFSSRDQSDALIEKLARTHVTPKSFVLDGQYLVQVGSFAAEEPARVRRNYLFTYVGMAPEIRMRRP